MKDMIVNWYKANKRNTCYSFECKESGMDENYDYVFLISYYVFRSCYPTDRERIYINITEKTVSKFDFKYMHIDFDKEELKFLSNKGFNLSEEHITSTGQDIDDWF